MTLMDELTLEFIVKALCGVELEGRTPITAPVFDSREAGVGSLFVALPGEKADGHDYVDTALKQGAAAALVDRELDLPYPLVDLRPGSPLPTELPSSPLLLRVDDVLAALQQAARVWCRCWLDDDPSRRIIGITGSVGKTTTKELVARVLSMRYNTLKSEKSFNNEIGIPVTVLNLRGEHQRAVLEMSMYVPGEIRLLASIAPPQTGVVTLIAPVHLERAGTIEAIVDAKAELVEALPPAPDGVAILNADDQRVMSMASRTQARIFTYGLVDTADLWADRIEGLGLEGIRFWIHYEGRGYLVKLPMLGRHSVHTALRAVAVGLVEGLTWDEVISGLHAGRSQLRLFAVKGPNGSIILDDTYNASPPSTIAALNLLNDLVEGRRIAVLGDMLELGTYEDRGHRDVGIRAAAVASLLVTVGERGRVIADEAVRGLMPPGDVVSFDTAEEAAEFLQSVVAPGDTILVKGSHAVGMDRIVSILQESALSGVDDR
jgi:UDP-N-acetylmuramoyl-tripeptide--D-alanyl-D-alanine ligase